MLAASCPRTAKISREVSNFIITEVLERSDDLIKNSYRRLTTENVARNEHWSRIAEKVAEKFDVPAEMDRVKSHFHNRKKVLLARVKDELKIIPNSSMWTTDEKVEELARRRICIGEHDEQLTRVCLDIEEEEKGRTDHYGNEPMMPPMVNLFTETSHQSLLSQLLNGSTSQTMVDKYIPSPKNFASSRESDNVKAHTPHPTVATTRAPLLSKLLSDPSTSRENGNLSGRAEAPKMARLSTETRIPSATVPDRKRPAESPMDKNSRSPALSSLNGQYISHLIVDVSSPEELKKLLSVLIDNGFSRFHSVTNTDMASSSIGADIRRAASLRPPDHITQESPNEDLFDKEDTNFWNGHTLPNASTPDRDMIRSIANRVERVDVEVKVEPITDYDEEYEEEEEVDEQTAELEAQLSSEAVKSGLAPFERPPSPKKAKINGGSANASTNGDTVTAHCAMCSTVIRLNSGGSKWNFYEHVMLKHSIYKPYKCPHCPYQTGRKVRVKQHALSQHHIECEPIDMITPEIRNEWLSLMSLCFPDHQYVLSPYEPSPGGMQKFVVIELNDDAATIDLLSYCVKKNFERVSLLSRLEDHPYLRDDQEVVQDDPHAPEADGMLLQLNDEERQRLMKLISTPGPQTLTMERIQMDGQTQHILQQHQIPSTSGYSNNFSIYIKNDTQYKDEPQQQPTQFDDTVNSVAHGHTSLSTLEMFACNASPPPNEPLRRKTPSSRKPEDSIKATCKVCGHDVMYSPQRTWNLMRHVWIMHQSSKPNQCSVCGYSHIKPYVRKHIESQHKHDASATILDLKSPELEAEWSQLLDQCFGVTYRKWKHHKEDAQHTAGDEDYGHEHHFSPEDDVMQPL